MYIVSSNMETEEVESSVNVWPTESDEGSVSGQVRKYSHIQVSDPKSRLIMFTDHFIYFEVEIVKSSVQRHPNISIGFARQGFESGMVGWSDSSVGLCQYSGKKSTKLGIFSNFRDNGICLDITISEGDVLGSFWNFQTGAIIFTMNGRAIHSSPIYRVYHFECRDFRPTVSLSSNQYVVLRLLSPDKFRFECHNFQKLWLPLSLPSNCRFIKMKKCLESLLSDFEKNEVKSLEEAFYHESMNSFIRSTLFSHEAISPFFQEVDATIIATELVCIIRQLGSCQGEFLEEYLKMRNMISVMKKWKLSEDLFDCQKMNFDRGWNSYRFLPFLFRFFACCVIHHLYFISHQTSFFKVMVRTTDAEDEDDDDDLKIEPKFLDIFCSTRIKNKSPVNVSEEEVSRFVDLMILEMMNIGEMMDSALVRKSNGMGEYISKRIVLGKDGIDAFVDNLLAPTTGQFHGLNKLIDLEVNRILSSKLFTEKCICAGFIKHSIYIGFRNLPMRKCSNETESEGEDDDINVQIRIDNFGDLKRRHAKVTNIPLENFVPRKTMIGNKDITSPDNSNRRVTTVYYPYVGIIHSKEKLRKYVSRVLVTRFIRRKGRLFIGNNDDVILELLYCPSNFDRIVPNNELKVMYEPYIGQMVGNCVYYNYWSGMIQRMNNKMVLEYLKDGLGLLVVGKSSAFGKYSREIRRRNQTRKELAFTPTVG